MNVIKIHQCTCPSMTLIKAVQKRLSAKMKCVSLSSHEHFQLVELWKLTIVIEDSSKSWSNKTGTHARWSNMHLLI